LSTSSLTQKRRLGEGLGKENTLLSTSIDASSGKPLQVIEDNRQLKRHNVFQNSIASGNEAE
jgi:hypothetical protein